MSKCLVAVTAGRWQATAIKRAKALGFMVIAIDSDQQASGLKYADVTIVTALTNIDYIFAELAAYPIDGVVSICSDAGMVLAGQIRERFNIVTGPNVAVSHALINKYLQRTAWQQHNVAQPRWCSAKQWSELLPKLADLSWPLVIKPVDSAGSRGVNIAQTRAQLATFFDQALSFSSCKMVIVEQFMPGIEYTVEGFVHQGQPHIYAVTEKTHIKDKPVAYRLMTATLSPEVLAQTQQLVCDAVVALGYANGPIHAEVMIDANNIVKMVELGGRGGGFFVFEKYVQLASGVDIVKDTLYQAVDLPLTIEPTQTQYTILEFIPSVAGTVRAISGLAQASLIHGVDVDALVKIGDKLTSAQSDGDRMAYILSCAPTLATAEQQVNDAKRCISIEVTS